MSEVRPRPPLREPKSGWDGEHGTTCPVFPVYRHPVFRRLKPVCYGWMPALLMLALLFGRFDLAADLIVLDLLFLLGVVALLAGVNQHGKLSGAARWAFRQLKGWRFLCPECLQFGPERFACGQCGAEVEEFLLLTHGLYLNDCPACHAPIFVGDHHTARARCHHCRGSFDLRHHQRRVRVLGVLGSESLHQLAHWPLLHQRTSAGEYLRGDDGTQLAYVVDVAQPPCARACYSDSHTCREIEALWVGNLAGDPLVVAQRLDRFIRLAEYSPEQRAALPVWVQDPDCAPAIRRVIEARFPRVEYGISRSAVLNRSSWVAGTPALARQPD